MATDRPGERGEAPILRRARMLIPGAAVAVIVLVVIGYAVLPTRSWLAQRNEIGRLEGEITAMEDANAELERRAAALNTVAEVERIARAELGLVRPGEEVYAVLPAAPEPVRLPRSWPFSALGAALFDS